MSYYLEVLEKIARAAEGVGRKKEEIELVAISKQRSLAEIYEVYNQGCRNFGENRVPEALEKISSLPKDIQWHFIGALQKNKVNKVVDQFALIHSVDSPELAEKLARASVNEPTKILLQVNTSGESTKQGLSIEGWRPHLETLFSLPQIKILGLMTMAPFTQNSKIIRKTFQDLYRFGEELKLPLLSMGMSQDYEIAIEEGANILRIGTAIFQEK